MDFYIYENWQADSKATIHRAKCSFCNYGQGTLKDKEEGKNGIWRGPFAPYIEAVTAAGRLQGRRIISNCDWCQPS